MLALDTVDGPLAIGLLDTATGTVAVRREAIERGQAERLPGFVAAALADAGWTPADIDRIVVTTGPGGFTGVRIGAAFARGLALALDVPAVGVPSLVALAASLRPGARGRPLVVVLEDRRGGLYAQAFGPEGAPLGEARLVDAEALAATLPAGAALGGPGAAGLAHVLGETAVVVAGGVDPAALARLGAAMADGPVPEPLYLRPADAVPPAPSGVTAPPPAVPLGSAASPPLRGGDQ